MRQKIVSLLLGSLLMMAAATLPLWFSGCVIDSPSTATPIATDGITATTPPTVVVYNTPQLIAALLRAETTPNLRITTVADRVYPVTEPLYVRGVGTTLGGKGIIEQRFSYSGRPRPSTGEPMPGVAIMVTPLLGQPEPWAANKYVGYLWNNFGGGYNGVLESMGFASSGGFKEEAPVQYPGPNPRHFKYAIARRILVPCEGVTVQDITIRNVDGGADTPMVVMRAIGATIRNAKATRSWPAGRGALGFEGSEMCLADHVDFTGVQFNSSRLCRLTNTVNGCGVSFEEGADSCIVDHCTLTGLWSNDATCVDNQVISCKFTGDGGAAGGNIISIGSTRLTVANCELESRICLGDPQTTNATLVNNKALALWDAAGSRPTTKQINNSWQR